MAGIQTTGFIDPHFSLQSHFFDPTLGIVEQVEGTALGATAPWVIGLALVVADENVFLKS